MGIAQNLGVLSVWIVALTSFVYLYYATLGKPKGWNEPLGWFRIVLAILGTLVLPALLRGLFPQRLDRTG